MGSVIFTQVFEHYEKWEDYQNGMYKPTPKENEEKLIELSMSLLSNPDKFFDIALKMVNKWKISASVNLTNAQSNRQAWIGQASCCFEYGVPEEVTRTAWSRMSTVERIKANNIADKVIIAFENGYKAKNTQLHMFLGK